MWYLAEFGEVVLLTEGTLPQPSAVVTDGLVIALSLRSPVSNTSYYTRDQLTYNCIMWKTIPMSAYEQLKNTPVY